jgi:hypothetical protein
LLIFDNVDRNYSFCNIDPDVYDVTKFFSGADYGFVLITIRLVKLERLRNLQRLDKVDQDQARAIL